MQNKLFSILLSTIFMALSLVVAHAGHPVVRCFSRNEYSAGSQNWAIGETPDGTMLFGNSNGLLSYDSSDWNLRGVNNSTAIRSLLVDNDKRRVYVGCSNDFGYFTSDSVPGRPRYQSLRTTIFTPDVEFGEIWNIVQFNNNLWFQGDFKLFCYDGTKSSVISATSKITSVGVYNSRLYLGFIDGKIGYVNGNNIVMLPETSILEGDRVCGLLTPAGGKMLIVTSYHGTYEYDGHSITKTISTLDTFIKDNHAFCATTFHNKIAVGTVDLGVIIHDIATGEDTYINQGNGLINNTVLSLEFDSYGNLWLGLDNGLAFVLTEAPFSRLLASSANFGAGYASLYKSGRLYFGTNQGLYSSPYNGSSIDEKAIKSELKGQIWSLDTIGGTLFVSGDAGLYYDTGNGFSRVDGIAGAWSVIPLKKYPGHALVSTYDNFHLLTNEGGRWVTLGRIAGYNDVGGKTYEDDNGNIWISHWIKGVYKLTPAKDYKSFERVVIYNHNQGFPSDNNSVSTIDGEVTFTGTDGIYRYNAASDSMIRDKEYSELLKVENSGNLYQAPTGDLWLADANRIVTVTKDRDGTFQVDTTSYRSMARYAIPGFGNYNFIDKDRMIMGTQEGFFNVDLSQATDSIATHKVFVTRVTANNDSVLYDRAFFAPVDSTPVKVPYSLNSIMIEYVAPEYRLNNAVYYSYILENYDEEWSPQSRSRFKEYTQLREGNYTFRVKAYDTYTGAVTECAFQFKVLPPWYRSVWATLIYLLLAAGGIYAGILQFRRSSLKAATIIEQEKAAELEKMRREAREEGLQKDFEIARLKSEQLEHDIKHKSGELSNITMNVIRKNEILLDIAARLTKLQQGVKGSKDEKAIDKELDHIKVLIRENISHDDDWRNFTRNFDVVYENYMKRLVQKYPNLSSSDQRLCAYIKMGLSSKEIAPLLNISYRSVEMTRYRLRKKMDLPREVNLAEYLRNF